jgi:hypothetical protein
VVCGSDSRSTAHLQQPGSYNGVIQPQTGAHQPTFAQLTRYFDRDFFRGK